MHPAEEKQIDMTFTQKIFMSHKRKQVTMEMMEIGKKESGVSIKQPTINSRGCTSVLFVLVISSILKRCPSPSQAPMTPRPTTLPPILILYDLDSCSQPSCSLEPSWPGRGLRSPHALGRLLLHGRRGRHREN
jgi:hypothetical protein